MPRATTSKARKPAAKKKNATMVSSRKQRPKPKVLKKAQESTASPAGISSDAVEKATGKPWAYWLDRLDADGAADMLHAQIAEHLASKRGIAPWWSQMITVGYEQARGRRTKHQVVGGYSVSASRTVGVAAAEAFAAWTDDQRRTAWLGKPGMTVRGSTPHKYVRITWEATPQPSNVEVVITPKSGGKSAVSVQHSKLPTAAMAKKFKAYWSERMDAFRDAVEGL